jgi:tRNA 5-methylaminomethyl-2-thiouridine biosynthesis bifunctional protein
MSRPLTPVEPATLEFASDGTPYSALFEDRYHSREGALAQAAYVFLGGNGLPGRWAARDRFVVLETGFGLGLNFLATWRAWRDDPARCRRLHFVSVEKHPFAPDDLTTLYRRVLPPDMADMGRQLVEHWPLAVGGLHRIEFEGGRVVLTLALGDVHEQLPQLTLRANALYLDGFSPARNPDMWSPRLCRQLKRLSAADATLATWTIAASVREALAGASFVTEKRLGFPPKRDMLSGHLHPAAQAAALHHRPEVKAPGHVAVIGAGLAGCALAERLAARGVQVSLIERHAAPAQEASGNAAGVLRPMIARDDSLMARLSRAAFMHASNHLRRLASEGLPLIWGPTGVMQIAHDDAHEQQLRDICELHALPGALVRYLSRPQMSRRVGHDVACGGWWFERGAWVNPPSLCAAHLARGGTAIARFFSREALHLDHGGTHWQVRSSHDVRIDADAVVLANAADARQLSPQPLPLVRVRGQVTLLPGAMFPQLQMTLCRDGYLCPTPDGDLNLGASFDLDDEDTTVRDDSHAGNLARLAALLPGAAAPPDIAGLRGRVGFRTASPDRMPLIGPLAATFPGLHAFTGLGSRGLVWSPLGAEQLASALCGDPLPLASDITEALMPRRFLPSS